jgi:hypothetical protein
VSCCLDSGRQRGMGAYIGECAAKVKEHLSAWITKQATRGRIGD